MRAGGSVQTAPCWYPPYKVIGSINFYQRKEVKDILAYLKTIDNGQDSVAIKRIINVPQR